MAHLCTLFASDIPVQSVNMYQSGGVEVVRRFPVQLKKGQNIVKIKDLPSSIVPSSVRVSGFDQVVKLLDVVSTDVSRCKTTSGSHNEKLQLLEAKKHRLECEKWVRSAEWSALYYYSYKLNGNNANPAGFHPLDEFRTESLASIKHYEKLCEEITQVEGQIGEARRKPNDGEVAVTLDADEGCTQELKITYGVTVTSSWAPFYELHMSTSENGQPSTKVSLHYYARISQSTGEDWKDVSLKLSMNPDDIMVPGISPTAIKPATQVPRRGRNKYYPTPIPQSSSWIPFPTSTSGATPLPPPIPPLPPLPTGAGSFNAAWGAPVPVSPSPATSWANWAPALPAPPLAFGTTAPALPAPPLAFGTTAPALPAPAAWAPVPMPRVPSPAPSLDTWSDVGFPATAKEKQPEKQSLRQSQGVDKDKNIDNDTTKSKAVATVTTMPISPRNSILPFRSFTVDGKRTILTDGLERQVALAVVPLEATLSYIVAPRSDRTVYLQCQVKNSSEYLLLEGAINVILNDEKVSTAYTGDVADDESFLCALGADPLIKVSYTQTTQTTQHTDVSSSKGMTVKVLTSKITVHNKHTFAIPELVVMDRIPTTEDKRARLTMQKPEGLNDVGAEQEVSTRVKLLHPEGNDKGNDWVIEPNASKPAKVSWFTPLSLGQREKDGRFEWKLSLGRGEKVELEAQWELRVPSDVSWMESYPW